jgi:toxin CcdB
MARFDVYANPDGDGYWLDIQADLLDGLNTRIVVPLLPRADAPAPAERLNPVFRIADEEFVLVTQFLSAVPKNILGAPLKTFEPHRTAIINAVDFLLQGF